MTLTKSQAHTMLALQASMNTRVDPDWLKARHPYLRAVVIEGAEAIEHHGWKWWKLQHHDLAQLQMEVIDIWHFVLSELLLRCDGSIEEANTALQEALQEDVRELMLDDIRYPITEMDVVPLLELLIAVSAVRRMSFPLFSQLLLACGMNWDELYRQYIGKNTLNLFRQDHGYREGTYRKEWDGREDNQHLVEILQEHDARSEDLPEQIYQSLSRRYAGI